LDGFSRDTKIQAAESSRDHNQGKNRENLPANPRRPLTSQRNSIFLVCLFLLREVTRSLHRCRIYAVQNNSGNEADATSRELSSQWAFPDGREESAQK